jgi:acyl-CoA thioesterase FadM
MLLLFRLAWLLLTRPRLRRRIAVVAPSELDLRVWPWDCDLNLHMTNARYATHLDAGRMILTHQLGLSRKVFRDRWFPVVGALSLRFRRELPPLGRYRLITRVVSWDERWFYVEQVFLRGDAPAAIAWIKVMLRAPGGPVPATEVLRAIGQDAPAPDLPADFALWRELNLSARDRGMGETAPGKTVSM